MNIVRQLSETFLHRRAKAQAQRLHENSYPSGSPYREEEAMSDLSDLELLSELGHTVEAEKPKTYSPLEARLIAGFEDILKFIEENGHPPQHGESRDIFERLYAVRLDQLRNNKQALSLLADLDTHGLLSEDTIIEVAEPNDDDLLKELGVDSFIQPEDDITKIKHVAPIAHRQAAEEIASREVCRDFSKFEPIFQKVRSELKSGLLESREGIKREDIKTGGIFVLHGQMAYIAEKGEEFLAPNKVDWDSRLRVIFDNGTESGLLLRSLLRSRLEDNTARTISSNDAGPLFSDTIDTEEETGTIYVLRSKSNLSEILPIREAIIKIGVTGGSVKMRLSNAKNEATYLLGDVEVIDEYILYNISRKKLESLIHQIFSDAQLEITIQDRFGKPFQPREWFLVPPEAVAYAVELIKSGEIKDYWYDRASASFQKLHNRNIKS